MGSFGDYAENKLLDHITGKAAFTQPTAYVALSLADPGESGAGISEPSGGAYARVATAAADWNSAAAGATSNANAITFPTATADWGTLTHFALFDAPTGGNLLAHGALTASKPVNNGDTPVFNAGNLSLTLD